jgi:hypothetical protein
MWRPDDKYSIRSSLISGTGCNFENLFMDVNSRHPIAETWDPFVAEKSLGIEYNANNKTAKFISEIVQGL